jgi:hypothetical protein
LKFDKTITYQCFSFFIEKKTLLIFFVNSFIAFHRIGQHSLETHPDSTARISGYRLHGICPFSFPLSVTGNHTLLDLLCAIMTQTKKPAGEAFPLLSTPATSHAAESPASGTPPVCPPPSWPFYNEGKSRVTFGTQERY